MSYLTLELDDATTFTPLPSLDGKCTDIIREEYVCLKINR